MLYQGSPGPELFNFLALKARSCKSWPVARVWPSCHLYFTELVKHGYIQLCISSESAFLWEWMISEVWTEIVVLTKPRILTGTLQENHTNFCLVERHGPHVCRICSQVSHLPQLWWPWVLWDCHGRIAPCPCQEKLHSWISACLSVSDVCPGQVPAVLRLFHLLYPQSGPWQLLCQRTKPSLIPTLYMLLSWGLS